MLDTVGRALIVAIPMFIFFVYAFILALNMLELF